MTTTYLPEVPLTRLIPHGANPRHQLRDLDELTASIKAKGVLEPLVVAPLNGTQYRIIAGHRRHAAAKAAGLTSVAAVLREDLDTPAKQLEAMVVENGQRVDLTPIEEAEAYQALLDFPTYTVAKVAKATGKSTKTIKGRLALAALPDKTRDRIHDGQISLQEANTLTEFVGTKDYASIVKTVGTSQFAYAVQRARDAVKAREQLAVIRAWLAEHEDWSVTEGWNVGRTVLASYQAPKSTAALEKALAALEGPHVVRTGYGDTWSICEPLAEKGDGDVAVPAREPDADWEAAQAAREQRAADLESARKVRAEWLSGRMGNLVVKDQERVRLLRLLVADVVRNNDYDEDAAAFVGMPPVPEDEKPWHDVVVDARSAWAGGLSEMQAWKALIALTFDVVRCGSTWDDSHIPSIHVAAALGYDPSDLETALITPTTEEETTP